MTCQRGDRESPFAFFLVLIWCKERSKHRSKHRSKRRSTPRSKGNAPRVNGFTNPMGKRRIPQVAHEPPATLHFAVVEGEVDLHGLTARQAETRVAGFVGSWAMRAPGAVVRIITGRGVGSEGAPVIQRRVREQLSGSLADAVSEWAVDIGGGAFLVRVQRITP